MPWLPGRRSERVLPPADGMRRHRLEGRTLVGLVIVLIVAVAAFWVLAQLGSLRRTAETGVTITSALFQPGGGTKDRRERGFHLRYVYVADGVSFPAITFRTWESVDEHHPKVCYDPTNPSDHLLVDGGVRCGAAGFVR